MKSGTCPKCKSAAVYKRTKGMSLGEGGVHVYIASQMISKPVQVDHYICAACGYFEMYVADKARLEQVAKDAALSQPNGWKKV
jgi:predicted nucleic-acid-binding Zn-ribbon protein